ncbi:hypothetical protein MTO96_003914 [Rhipicephalus appendiculatus]
MKTERIKVENRDPGAEREGVRTNKKKQSEEWGNRNGENLFREMVSIMDETGTNPIQACPLLLTGLLFLTGGPTGGRLPEHGGENLFDTGEASGSLGSRGLGAPTLIPYSKRFSSGAPCRMGDAACEAPAGREAISRAVKPATRESPPPITLDVGSERPARDALPSRLLLIYGLFCSKQRGCLQRQSCGY